MNDSALKVKVLSNGCWEWQGRTDGYGRPVCDIKGRVTRVQHLYYGQKHGYKPKQVYTTCENLRCVNPDHIKDKDKSREYMLYLKTALASTELSPDDRAKLTHELSILTEKVKVKDEKTRSNS